MSSEFLQSISDFMYKNRYAKKSIEAYLKYIKDFIRFHEYKHPRLMHDLEVDSFLSYLVNVKRVSASTQSLALNALVFLYKRIIEKPLSDDLGFIKSRRQVKLPTVLTQSEVMLLFQHTTSDNNLPIALLYGSGLRLMECLRLRCQDIDFDFKSVKVWNGKGGKNRVVTLSPRLIPELEKQIDKVKKYLEIDLNDSRFSGVYLPHRLRMKYKNAAYDLSWQYLFPSTHLSKDPETKHFKRQHLDQRTIQRAVRGGDGVVSPLERISGYHH